MIPRFWSEEELALLREHCKKREGKTLDLQELAKTLGRTTASVASKLAKLGLGMRGRKLFEKRQVVLSRCLFSGCKNLQRNPVTLYCEAHGKQLRLFGKMKPLSGEPWTEKEIQDLKDLYLNNPKGFLNLKAFQNQTGRHPGNISRKARELGLPTEVHRKWRKSRNKYATRDEALEALRERVKTQWKHTPHPRGMAGKKHTQEVKTGIAKKSAENWSKLTPDQKRQQIEKSGITRIKNNSFAKRKKSSWKSGYREVGSRRIFFRSRWEFNYGLYLQHLKDCGRIQDWAHEEKAFLFQGESEGPVAYLPDFTVTLTNAKREIHEVKGWMDPRSKRVLERMEKYYPEEKITVIDKNWFITNLELLRTFPSYEEAKYY